jgi:uncharacterized SAM-binding protein YcdF (DUF218 family)
LAHAAGGIPVWVVLLGVAVGLAVVGLFAWRVVARHQAAQEAPIPGVVPVAPSATSTAAVGL